MGAREDVVLSATAANASSGTRRLGARSRSWCWGRSRSPPAPTPSSTGRTRQRHDRPRQPRRHRRQPELHHRRRPIPLGVAVDATHVYWTQPGQRARSAAPTSTAGRQPELHHRRQRPPRGGGRRQPHLLGDGRPGSAPARSAAPTSTAPRRPELHHRRQRPGRRGGRRQPRLLGQLTADTIGRANLDGTSVNQSFITGADCPAGVAVDADHVYWANPGTTRSAVPTSTARRRPELHHRRSEPVGVAVDAGHVYWTNFSTGTIGRANLDGTGATRASSPAPAARSGWRSTGCPPPAPAATRQSSARAGPTSCGGPTTTT